MPITIGMCFDLDSCCQFMDSETITQSHDNSETKTKTTKAFPDCSGTCNVKLPSAFKEVSFSVDGQQVQANFLYDYISISNILPPPFKPPLA